MDYTMPPRRTIRGSRLLFVAIMMAAAATTKAADADWHSIPVPGTWEKSGLPGTAEYDGHAWYHG